MKPPDKIYVSENLLREHNWNQQQCKDTEYICKESVLRHFFGCIGYFNHYAYFTKELWRKVKDFKNADEAEVKCAFLSLWTKHELGIITYPVGCGWYCNSGSEGCFNEYIERWKPLFEDFDKWCLSQR